MYSLARVADGNEVGVEIRGVVTLVVLLALPWPAGAATGDEWVCPLRGDWTEGSHGCPCEGGWKPTKTQLAEILKTSSERGFSLELPPAVLCNADLTYRDLSAAVLFHADLRGAQFFGANMEGAYLNRADLRSASLRGVDGKNAVLEHANLQNADLVGANLQDAILNEANLKEADLSQADLQRSKLERADLQGAKLFQTNLAGANLDYANLREIDGEKVNLTGARLRGADLEGANLERAQLRGTDLFYANLRGANLFLADIEAAHLARSTVAGSVYAPASPPPDGYLVGMRGLRSVTFPPGQQSGVVQLRSLLRAAGLRDLEREATYAIERNKAWHARRSDDLAKRVAGWLNLAFFEWTTGYGLFPQQAIFILFAAAGIAALLYTVPIVASPGTGSATHAIIRVWPAGRAETSSGGFAPAGTERMERLGARGFAVFGWAVYFSLLSAFHLGWRDLNVGTWLTRIQPSEFVLRGRGWVRVVSGIQSLVSVYLLALWALTQFGRPFQ